MKPRKTLTYQEALSRAANLCDKCEQCSPDIIKKLDSWGLSSADSRKVIKTLEELNYLDDNRFAHAYAHDKMAYSGWGRRKIIQGLWAKRLPRDIIDGACDLLDEDEYNAVAVKVVKSKIRSMEPWGATYEDKMKVLRHAAQRGFEPSLIVSILNRIIKGDEDC